MKPTNYLKHTHTLMTAAEMREATLREQVEKLKRRVTWFLSITEGMLASEQVKAILDETK